MSQWIVFHVTERCGLACLHCLRDPSKKPADVPLALVERLLPEAKALHGIKHVGFTGGDPLLWPHLEGAIDAAVRNGFTWHLVSSGKGIDRLMAMLDAVPARRASCTAVDLSLDGATEATHDAIRDEGNYREVMAATAACSARGIPFAFQMTVNARNESEIEALGLLAGELGALKVAFAMTHATGGPEDAGIYLSPEALDRVANRVLRLGTLLTIPVVLSEGFRHGDRFHVCEPFRSGVLHVTPHGMLNLCCNHSGVPGGDEDVVADLSTTSLAEAHRRVLGLIQKMERDRLDEIIASPGAVPNWSDFPCNWCLAKLGKPHWVEGGSSGPQVVRIAKAAR